IDSCIFLGNATPVMLTAAPPIGWCAQSNRGYFADHYLTLNLGEQVVINLSVMVTDIASEPSSSDGYYEFQLALEAVADGKLIELRVKNGEGPFRLTSYASPYSAAYLPISQDLHILGRGDPAVYCSCSLAR